MKRYLLLICVFLFLLSGIANAASSRAWRTPTTGKGGISTFGTGKDWVENELDEWEAYTDNVLTAAAGSAGSHILEVYSEGGGGALWDQTGPVTIGGATTDSDYFRIIRAASGEGHSGIALDDGSCAGFDLTGDDFVGISPTEDYFQMQDIVIKCSSNSASGLVALLCRGNENTWIGVLIHSVTNAGAGEAAGFRQDQADTNYWINCLVADCKDEAFEAMAGTIYVYNCSAINNGKNGYDMWGAATVTTKNCLADNNAPDYGGTYDNSDTCGSSDATSPTVALQNQNYNYVNAGAEDFHLAAGDGVDDGTDLSGDGTVPFDDDANNGAMGAAKAGQARSGSWDLGFDELDVAAAVVRRKPQVIIVQ